MDNYKYYVARSGSRDELMRVPIQEEDYLERYRNMPYVGAILLMFFMGMLTVILSVVVR